MGNNNSTQQEQEVYIPEYDPNKYAKEIKITRIIYITLFAVGILGAALFFILATVFPDWPEWSMVRVRGVLQKDWDNIVIFTLIILTLGVLPGIFMKTFNWKYKLVAAIHAEPDEQKRLAMCDDFDDLQRSMRRIHWVSIVSNWFGK